MWSDFSEFVVHFTRPTPPTSEYENQLSILSNLCLEARNAFGIARSNAPATRPQKTVCFSEVPLHCLDRIAKRRSKYGLGFTKMFARSRGASPVWYVEKDSPQHAAIETMKGRALTTDSDPIWMLTPFIDVPGVYPTGTYRFEWEREWRCLGDFPFTETDVAFLLIPEDLHDGARGFFQDAREQQLGPSFDCPFIDSSWDEVKIKKAFEVRR